MNKAKKWGQYFTPDFLASDIVKATKHLYCAENLSVFEPAYGKGAFLTALQNEGVDFKEFLGIEIDKELCGDMPEKSQVINADFTCLLPKKQYNLLITNPPYTRHHLLEGEQKTALALKIRNEMGLVVNGLSGLYCYFLFLADKWLQENAVAVWLLPTEFLDVNYGKSLREYLLNNVQLLNVHIYDTKNSSLFENAMISSCVIVYRKTAPKEEIDVAFTFGDKMCAPVQSQWVSRRELKKSSKWLKLLDEKNDGSDTLKKNTLGDYFYIKRGIATGYNKYFILSREEIEKRELPICCFTPIIENTRNVSNAIIESDENGFPAIKQQLFVLDTDLPIEEIKTTYPRLYEYLLYGISLGVKERHLVGKRKIWYKQENRTPAPFYCSYMARKKHGKLFHFLWNKTNIIVSNNFLMLYPKPCLESAVKQNWLTFADVYRALNNIETDFFEKQTRTYAMGLSKLEPKELGKVEMQLNLE